MPMAMMQIRKMRVRMRHRFMPVWMGMRLAVIALEIVGMLVMLVMRVQVFVFQYLVLMQVFVTLADMQPDPERHQAAGTPEAEAGYLSQQQQ